LEPIWSVCFFFIIFYPVFADSLLSMLTSLGLTFFESWKVPSYFSWTWKKREFS
jgi:hypothetical protein